jgi:hypothetical protein
MPASYIPDDEAIVPWLTKHATLGVMQAASLRAQTDSLPYDLHL